MNFARAVRLALKSSLPFFVLIVIAGKSKTALARPTSIDESDEQLATQHANPLAGLISIPI